MYSMDQEWQIQYVDRKIADAPLGLITIEWTLSRSPEEEWIKYLTNASGSKSGTRDFLSRVPEVTGKRLRFTVLEADLENAVNWVEKAIPSANQLFDTYVMSRRRQEQAKREKEEAARQRRILEARQRLDRMDH